MKQTILLLAVFAAVFSSCTSAYKTGQTPDDVYYSPAPPRDEYAVAEKDNDRRYQYTDEYYDNRFLRMKVSNRYRWNDLNDWYYYERYGYGYNYYYGNFYNPYNSWNYYYNPYYGYYGNVFYSNPKTIAYTPPVKPRAFNLAGYTNNTYNNKNTTTTKSRTNNSYNNKNQNPAGRTTRSIFSGSNDNRSSNGGRISSGTSGNNRSYSPSNSNSNSSSSSSSGRSSGGNSSSGGVSRPGRN